MKHHRSPHTAFTLIELLVVISIIAVLAGLGLSAMSSASQKGKAIKCLSFQRQIGAASMLYAGEHDGTLPVTTHQRRQGEQSWTLSLQPYAGGTLTFRCPADEDKTRIYSYVLNDFLTPNPSGASDLDFSKMTRLESPRSTLFFGEASKDYTNADHFHFSEYRGQQVPPTAVSGQIAVERHGGGANYLFADGHVETLDWKIVQERLSAKGSQFIDPTADGEK